MASPRRTESKGSKPAKPAKPAKPTAAPAPLVWRTFSSRPSTEEVETQVRAFVAGLAARDALAMFAACPRYHSSQPYIRERDREWEKREFKSLLKAFVDHGIVAKYNKDPWHEQIGVAAITGDERNIRGRLSFSGAPTKFGLLFVIQPHGSEWVVAYNVPRVMPV